MLLRPYLTPKIKAGQTGHANRCAAALTAEAGSTRVSDLKAYQVVNACTSYDGLSAWTRFGRASAMRKLLRYLRDCGGPNLTAHVPKVPLPAPRPVTCTTAERDLLLNAASLHVRCWLLLCSDLALRSGTAARVAPKHYNAENHTLTLTTKAGRAVTLPVTEELQRLFALVPRNADPSTPFVCLLHPNHNIGVAQLRQSLWRLRQSLNMRQLWAHDLRRTTAVAVQQATHDLRMVQAVLGHEQLRSTLHYLDHRNTEVPALLLETLSKRGRE